MPLRKLRRCDYVGLSEVFGHADTYGRMLILLKAAGSQPHVKRQHLRVHCASRQVIDSGERIDLVWVVEYCYSSKGLGFGTHTELRREESRPGAAKRLRRGPLD